MKISKDKKITIIISVVIVFLVISNITFWVGAKSLEWDIVYMKAVPHVELINYMSFDSNGIASGSVTGFVVFDNLEDQPRNARQYYTITAYNEYNEKGEQLFLLEDIISLLNIPPSTIGTSVLNVNMDYNGILYLIDENGNSFNINKTTKKVKMRETTGKDSSYLITNQTDFKDFIRNWLK